LIQCSVFQLRLRGVSSLCRCACRGRCGGTPGFAACGGSGDRIWSPLCHMLEIVDDINLDYFRTLLTDFLPLIRIVCVVTARLVIYETYPQLLQGDPTNRRAFIISAGTTAGVAATMGLGTRKMFGQANPPNPTLYNALIAAHAIAAGNLFYATPSANDWWTVNNAATACANEWLSNGRDAGVQSAASKITPSDIITANLNTTLILSTIQAYQSKFTAANVAQSVAFVNDNSAMVPSVLEQMVSGGMTPQLTTIMQQSARIAEGLANGTIPAVASRFSAHPAYKPSNPPGGGGGGGYNCAVDGAAIFAAGLAFATLSVMSLGSFDLLAGAAWAGIAAWGGLGTTGWGVGHVIAGCGF